MIEVMEQRLEMKKKRLEQLQEYFRIDIMNINQSTYEDNAISALLEMKKIKTEIAELELCLQLKWLFHVKIGGINMRLLLEGKNGNKDVTLDNVKEYNESVHDRKIYVSYNDDRENESYSMIRYMAVPLNLDI